MLGFFHPSFGGVWKPDRLADDLTQRLADRVRTGLFPSANPRRNRYEIVNQGGDLLRFRSTALLTAINVGWNDVELRIDRTAGTARFSVSFWTWTRYCVFLGLGLGAFFAVAVVLPVLFGFYLFPEDLYPSRRDVVRSVVPIVTFWCVIWPWLLVAMHKRFARIGFLRLLDEVNSADSRD